MKDKGGSLGGSNGALDGLNTADLKRGFSKGPTSVPSEEDQTNFMDFYPPKAGGFLGRPEGHER